VAATVVALDQRKNSERDDFVVTLDRSYDASTGRATAVSTSAVTSRVASARAMPAAVSGCTWRRRGRGDDPWGSSVADGEAVTFPL